MWKDLGDSKAVSFILADDDNSPGVHLYVWPFSLGLTQFYWLSTDMAKIKILKR